MSQLLSASDVYEVDGLRSACEDLLTKQLTDDNAVATLNVAVKYDLNQRLKTEAARKVAEKFNEQCRDLDDEGFSLVMDEINQSRERHSESD